MTSAGFLFAAANGGSIPPAPSAAQAPLLKSLWKSEAFFVALFFVYILWSHDHHKTYVGFSSDPEQRLISHNLLAKKGWTIRYRPWQLVDSFPCSDKKQALLKEKYFKTGAGRDEIQRIPRSKGLLP